MPQTKLQLMKYLLRLEYESIMNKSIKLLLIYHNDLFAVHWALSKRYCKRRHAEETKPTIVKAMCGFR